MADTAQVVAALDVVVSVDTAVAHLAAAMGRPVLLLLPAYGDWRWHYARDDSPWYPSVKIFRCGWKETYESVVARVRDALIDIRAAKLTAASYGTVQ
jgi:ADP-heptose:LPS heptosyltransferase